MIDRQQIFTNILTFYQDEPEETYNWVHQQLALYLDAILSDLEAGADVSKYGFIGLQVKGELQRHGQRFTDH